MRRRCRAQTNRFIMAKTLDILLFTRELSILLRSGVSLGETLESLREKTESGTLRNIIVAVSSDVENGQSLAHALERFPKVFDPLYINLVRLGESSGTLRENLDFLTRQLEGSYILRQKVRGIMLYPVIVFSMAILLGGLMSIFILPRLIRLFDSFDIVLPLSTRLLLAIAWFMQLHGIAFFLSIGLFFFLFRLLVSHRLVQPHWHRLILSLPVIGPLFRDIAVAHFFRDMGIMIQSGLPILEALAIEETVMENRFLSILVGRVSRVVAQGGSLSGELAKKEYRIFSPIVTKMIAAGERTGRLGETFFYLEHFFEDETDRKIKNMTVLLEPILLILVGAIVLFLSLAILTPIYSLTGSIRR